jgi:TolA-binding protein
MEAELFSSPDLMLTADNANQAVLLYSRFVNENPADSAAPVFLFKCAEMFRAVNNGKMANEYYQRVINEYPQCEKAPLSLFLQGFVYENLLNDLVMAQKSYRGYLEKYPDGEFAKDAEVLIQNLGKSPEEMIREFEAKTDTNKVS